MNALFRYECKTPHKKYGKTHKHVVGPIDNFKSEITILDNADRGSITHQTALAKYKR